MMILKTDLEMLKSRMEKLEEAKTRIKTEKADLEFKQFPLREMIKQVEEEIADLKLAISEAAISEFKKTGEKSQLGGVKVQEKKWSTISYDSDEALKFAKEKDMFLILDKKGFETAAPSLNLDFVKIESGTKEAVTFPKEIKLED